MRLDETLSISKHNWYYKLKYMLLLTAVSMKHNWIIRNDFVNNNDILRTDYDEFSIILDFIISLYKHINIQNFKNTYSFWFSNTSL